MPKIFISHSWKDNDLSRNVAQYLKQDGAEIWIDYARIEGGDKLPKRIGNALKWCDTLLLLWSQAAADSYWVEEEWTNALALRKRIIPCVLDNTELPPILSNRLYLDFRKFDHGYHELCRTLKLVITPTRQKPTVKATTSSFPAPSANVFKPIFRNYSEVLSIKEAKAMIEKRGFFSSDWNKEGHRIKHQFEEKSINGDNIVFDHASVLIWQQSGSTDSMKYEAAKMWIQKVNEQGFAGYIDWRLPTLEEAMSLVEPERKSDNKYIDSVFAKNQTWIWTSDQVAGSSKVWVVDFDGGKCDIFNLFFSYGYVRAVRSGESSKSGGNIKDGR